MQLVVLGSFYSLLAWSKKKTLPHVVLCESSPWRSCDFVLAYKLWHYSCFPLEHYVMLLISRQTSHTVQWAWWKTMDDWCTQSIHTSVGLLGGSFERCPSPLRGAGVWQAACGTWLGKLCISEAQLSLVLHHLLDFSPATLNSAEAKPVYREGRYTGSSGVLVSCFFCPLWTDMFINI